MNKFSVRVTYTSKLSKEQFEQRLTYLRTLQLMLSNETVGTGYNIYQNVKRALHKYDNFTGLLKLNHTQSEYLINYITENWYDSCTLEYRAVHFYVKKFLRRLKNGKRRN